MSEEKTAPAARRFQVIRVEEDKLVIVCAEHNVSLKIDLLKAGIRVTPHAALEGDKKYTKQHAYAWISAAQEREGKPVVELKLAAFTQVSPPEEEVASTS